MKIWQKTSLKRLLHQYRSYEYPGREINLVSTLTAASECENYQKGVEFYGGQEIFKDFAAWTAEVPTVNYGRDTYEIEDLMTEAMQQITDGGDVDEMLGNYQEQAEAAIGQ